MRNNTGKSLCDILKGVALGGAILFSGCETPNYNNSSNYNPPSQPGVKIYGGIRVLGEKQDDGSYVYQFPSDPTIQREYKNRYMRIISREKWEKDLVNGDLPDITHVISHPDGSGEIIFKK